MTLKQHRALLPAICPHCRAAIEPAPLAVPAGPAGEMLSEPGLHTVELATLARIARAAGDRARLEDLCILLAEIVDQRDESIRLQGLVDKALDRMAAHTARFCKQCLADQEKAALQPLFARRLDPLRGGLPPVLWGHDLSRVEEAGSW